MARTNWVQGLTEALKQVFHGLDRRHENRQREEDRQLRISDQEDIRAMRKQRMEEGSGPVAKMNDAFGTMALGSEGRTQAVQAMIDAGYDPAKAIEAMTAKLAGLQDVPEWEDAAAGAEVKKKRASIQSAIAALKLLGSGQPIPTQTATPQSASGPSDEQVQSLLDTLKILQGQPMNEQQMQMIRQQQRNKVPLPSGSMAGR